MVIGEPTAINEYDDAPYKYRLIYTDASKSNSSINNNSFKIA